MSTVRVIGLPNGRPVSIATYVNGWRKLKTMPAGHPVANFCHFPEPAHRLLGIIRAGVHDRINRHLPGYGQGRKWEPIWQADARRTAGHVNTPRLVVRWLPADLKKRLAHRLTTD